MFSRLLLSVVAIAVLCLGISTVFAITRRTPTQFKLCTPILRDIVNRSARDLKSLIRHGAASNKVRTQRRELAGARRALARCSVVGTATTRTADNHLRNSGFERRLSAWRVNGSGGAISDVVAHSGFRSLSLEAHAGAGDADTTVRQVLNLAGERELYAAVMLRSGSKHPRTLPEVKIVSEDAGGGRSIVSGLGVNQDEIESGWILLDGIVKSPASAVKLHFEIVLPHGDGTGPRDRFWFDDAFLADVTKFPLNDPAPIPTATSIASAATPTATRGVTPRPTAAVTMTSTRAPAETATKTRTPSATATRTPPAPTPATNTPTRTPLPAATATPTRTPSATATSTSQNGGLKGEYFNNIDLTGLVGSRTDAKVDFCTAAVGDCAGVWTMEAPDFPGVTADGIYSERWSGEVYLDSGGSWTFYVTSDDGARLFVNGQQLVDNWTNHGKTEDSGTFQAAAAGWYSIRVEHYNDQRNAIIQLRYSGASVAKAIIPASKLRPNTQPPQRVLTFSDEFNGSQLDTSKWTTHPHWFPTDINGEVGYYAPDGFNFGDGLLRIRSERRQMAGHSYTTGELNSIDKFYQTYGYFELRAKLPAGKNLWPAFWLMSQDRQWPPEIDIFEFVSPYPDIVTLTYHYPDANGQDHSPSPRTYYKRAGVSNWTSDYHIYAVDWRPGVIIWYIDNVEVFRFTGSQVPSKPMYIIINTAIGGSWPGNPDPNAPFPTAYFDLDYLRVYR